jgi:hypothetical protein
LGRLPDGALDRLEDLGPQLGAARDALAAEQRRHANAVAKELEPRHGSAVKGLLTAVEALSAAVDAAVRREFAGRAGQAQHPRLPPMPRPGALGSGDPG